MSSHGDGHPPAVAVQGLTVRFGAVTALEDVTFVVPRGSLFAVLGPNGSGKSTLIRVILGLVRPESGSAVVLGEGPGKAASRIGYVPQASRAEPGFPITAAEVVAMGLHGRRARLRWGLRRDPAVKRALAALDVAGLADRQLADLSGGQQRRVLLARALVGDPELLLLDEPAAGLDAAADEELTEVIRGLAARGRTVVAATHDIGGVAESYDHAVLLDRRVIAGGPVAEVLTDDLLHRAFGRQLLALQGLDLGRHHDITFRDEH